MLYLVLPESDEESDYSPESSSDDEDDDDVDSKPGASSDDNSDTQSMSSKGSIGTGRERGRGRPKKGEPKGKVVANGTTPGRPGRRKARGDVEVVRIQNYLQTK